jgi:hypothetical protein
MAGSSRVALLARLLPLAMVAACREHGTRLTIFSPKGGSHFVRGDTIHFAAELNSDKDPGLISRTAWHWVSDKQGELGESPRLDTPNLSPGKHVITLSVPHRLGTSSASVTVFVDSALR